MGAFIYGMAYETYIYIYIYIDIHRYIHVDRGGHRLTSVGLAQAHPNNALIGDNNLFSSHH